MAFDNDKQAEILLAIQKLQFQMERFVADQESEKEVRRRRNDEIDKQIRELQEWKTDLHGRLVVTLTIGGALWALIVSAIILILNKIL